MIDLKNLEKVVKEGLELLKQEKGLVEGVIYASANERTIGRIVYSTHLPSSGLAEPKSDSDFGVSVEMWFDDNNKKIKRRLLGMGHEANDLTTDGVKRAIAKARVNGIEDQDFSGFLDKKEILKYKIPPTSFNKGIGLGIAGLTQREESELIVKLGWETIEGAIDPISGYAKKRGLTPEKLAFILNGDNFIVKERMALATTSGIVDSDETFLVLSFITAMLEKENSKGSSWGARVLPGSDYTAYEYGRRAALSSINGIGGKRIKSGKYRVIFGHQAVCELFGSLYVPHVNLGMVEMGASLFQGKYGQQIASRLLTIYDDATLPGGAGSKRITCEGYPTGKTMLIDRGKLVGYLSNSRTRNKIMAKPELGKRVLGVDPHEIRQALDPRNGFRFDRGGGRVAGSSLGIHATNLVVDSAKPVSPEKLIRDVGDGIFIGRLWYTYPIGGYSSGIITGTAIAECYTIKNGKLGDPILPNTLRLEDNIGEMAKNIIGVGNNQKPTILWASDEITHAPWVGIDSVSFYEINESM
jgi:PmbA protein